MAVNISPGIIDVWVKEEDELLNANDVSKAGSFRFLVPSSPFIVEFACIKFIRILQMLQSPQMTGKLSIKNFSMLFTSKGDQKFYTCR